MKIFNTFLAILVLSFLFSNSKVTYADEKIHGSVCQPANLSQALTLGFGSSQLGTTNNSANIPDDFPVITGPSFFVTCPINRSSDDNTIDIWVEFVDGHFSGNVTCSVFSTSVDFSSPANVDSIVVVNPSTNPSDPPPVIAVGKATMQTPFVDYDVNVVCALPPQTRIKSFYTYNEVSP